MCVCLCVYEFVGVVADFLDLDIVALRWRFLGGTC